MRPDIEHMSDEELQALSLDIIWGDEAQLQYEARNSIVLKRNAKGEYAWDVKIYWDVDVKSVVEELQHIDGLLRERFL